VWRINSEPVVIDGGWRVAENDTHAIDILKMAFNYRIVLSERATNFRTYTGGWCYVGKDMGVYLYAYMCAVAWAMDGGDEPLGWNKNVTTGEWCENGKVLVAE
jgi:hypothetical protein